MSLMEKLTGKENYNPNNVIVDKLIDIYFNAMAAGVSSERAFELMLEMVATPSDLNVKRFRMELESLMKENEPDKVWYDFIIKWFVNR